MSCREFHAMGTTWWVTCDAPGLLAGVERAVRALERRLSRFLPDSALSRLDRERQVSDPALAAVTKAALALRTSTRGMFDPTLGAQLRGLGYDRPFVELGRAAAAVACPPPRRDALEVEVTGDHVRLTGEGSLDLGGVAKGWTVDRLVERLRRSGGRWGLVDGGGDIRGFGRVWGIGVGDGLAVTVSDEAVATSSTLLRRWRDRAGLERHHIVDPRSGVPARTRVVTATVVAPTATEADGLATALLVDPDLVLARLPAHGARAALRDDEGRWWTTTDWREAA